ncbi:MAG: hypothetical protein FJX45_07050 [Alphaproteobacteria bacterium]|nr:hypothetical protein [Alphaproteobacteria bacterium]MBM3652713.1 hypothetical protein [Alphaproteobacteria bacterium]
MTDPGNGQLEAGAEYALSVSQDRTCFTLRNKADHMIAELRGDDAARFRQDYDELKLQYPDWNADRLLAQLWDQGGYGWLAQQEE